MSPALTALLNHATRACHWRTEDAAAHGPGLPFAQHHDQMERTCVGESNYTECQLGTELVADANAMGSKPMGAQ